MWRNIGLITIVTIIPLLSLASSDRTHAQETSLECVAALNEIDVLADGTTIIGVRSDEAISVAAAIPEGARENVVYIEVLGRLWEISRVRANQAEWASSLPVDEYARWGNGLYRVVWKSLSDDDLEICELAATVNVEGSIFGSVIGILAIIAMAVSLTGLVFTMKTVINEGGRWAIKVLLKGDLEREEEGGTLRVRPKLSVGQTLLGTLLGLILAGSTLTSLQQAAVSLPTLELALSLAVPFALIGALAGSFMFTRE
jgi:hypothetical protein